MFEQVVNAMELTGRPRKIVFKIERYFDRYLNPLIRVVMKGVGIVLVIVACFLLLSITFFWFYAIVPMITSEYSFFRFFNILLGIYISFCLFFNYILTISSDPGTPPKEWLDKMDQLEQQQKKNNNKNNNNNNIDNIDNEINENNISTSTSSSVIIDIEKNKIVNDDDDDEDEDRNRDPKKGEGFSSWCKKCNQHKPPRTHHCHICNRCICRMDHHCPWMNNCVGYRNHRYFILFLFYLLVGSFYIVSIFGLILGDYIGYNKSIYYTYYPVMFFIGILALSMLIAMGGFFGWHLYLIITNQTTIEFQYNRLLMATNNKQGELSYNEYDVGPTKNLEMLFGSSKWYWILLPSLRPLPYDGTYFPSMKTVGSSKDYHYSNRIV